MIPAIQDLTIIVILRVEVLFLSQTVSVLCSLLSPGLSSQSPSK